LYQGSIRPFGSRRGSCVARVRDELPGSSSGL
jgi:hypothetical protein